VSIRLLIADDHPVVRAGLTQLLSGVPDFTIVGEAESGRQTCALIQELIPDVVLLDLRMPEGGGLFVLEELGRREQRARVLVLTTYEDPADFSRVMNAGARGYLLKDVPRAELCAAIRRVQAGEQVVSVGLEARAVGRVAAPSRREREVLNLVADGLSNREIARHLFISEATVKTHLGHLFDKLEARTRTEVVVAAHRSGWLDLGRNTRT
jgi:DNA-binding NarL/FixJ family response regulator